MEIPSKCWNVEAAVGKNDNELFTLSGGVPFRPNSKVNSLRTLRLMGPFPYR